MRGHPAVGEAAVALLCGWQPLGPYAELDGDAQSLGRLVLEEANELRAKELEVMAKAIGAHAGNRIGEILAKVFGS